LNGIRIPIVLRRQGQVRRPNRKSAFQYLTLPITASDVTFATGSLFNFPMILSRPLVGIRHTRDACTR
jgi:hypothetical protein